VIVGVSRYQVWLPRFLRPLRTGVGVVRTGVDAPTIRPAVNQRGESVRTATTLKPPRHGGEINVSNRSTTISPLTRV
jgi:hypothetical protein